MSTVSNYEQEMTSSILISDQEPPLLGVTLSFSSDQRRQTRQSTSFALTSYSEWLETQAEMAACSFYRYMDYLV